MILSFSNMGTGIIAGALCCPGLFEIFNLINYTIELKVKPGLNLKMSLDQLEPLGYFKGAINRREFIFQNQGSVLKLICFL